MWHGKLTSLQRILGILFLKTKDFRISEPRLGNLYNFNLATLLIRYLAHGLVLKVPYFWTSFYQVLELKAP